MNKRQLEKKAARILRDQVNSAINQTIAVLNAEGHSFTRESVDDPTEWIDNASAQKITITCAMGVSAGHIEPGPMQDPDVERFLALVDSGDPQATLLNQLEGDIANGGMFQLYENKGPAFFTRAAAALLLIGCRTKANLLRKALVTIEQGAPALTGFAALRRQLARIDATYDRSTESVASKLLLHRS